MDKSTITAVSLLRNEWIRAISIQIFALLVIYLIPTLSHLSGLKLYLIEPMRLMVILAIAHSNKKNALLLAITLPIFSYAISIHPSVFKSLIICIELSAMVFLFYGLSKYMKFFPAILGAIIASKLLYYLLKIGLIQTSLLNDSLISTPILVQLITTIVFSAYIWLFFRKQTSKEADL